LNTFDANAPRHPSVDATHCDIPELGFRSRDSTSLERFLLGWRDAQIALQHRVDAAVLELRICLPDKENTWKLISITLKLATHGQRHPKTTPFRVTSGYKIANRCR
jgi:hypothetical protein